MKAAYNKGKGRAVKWLRDHADYALDDCLIWPFGRRQTGYGCLGFNGEVYYAHRMMCELVHGKPPTPSHEAAHSCGMGMSGCVHPKHLSWKTPSENQMDRRGHGTAATNKWGSGGKLTIVQKQEIIALKGQKTQLEIANMFGVHFQTISRLHLRGINPAPKLRGFQPHEDEVLRKCQNMQDAAKQLGRTYNSVQSRAKRLREKPIVYIK